jgi:hypothetical protein
VTNHPVLRLRHQSRPSRHAGGGTPCRRGDRHGPRPSGRALSPAWARCSWTSHGSIPARCRSCWPQPSRSPTMMAIRSSDAAKGCVCSAGDWSKSSRRAAAPMRESGAVNTHRDWQLMEGRLRNEAGVFGRADHGAHAHRRRRRSAQSRQPGRPTVFGRTRGPSPGGAAMFRVRHRGEGIDDAATIEGAREMVRGRRRAGTTWRRSGPSPSPRATRAGRGAG